MQRIVVIVGSLLVLSALVAAQEVDQPLIRIFVAESEAQAFSAGTWGGTSGGSNDQTVEIQKNLTEQDACTEQNLRVTNRPQRAHFVIMMDRNEGNKIWGFAGRDNKIAVFDGWGDMIYSNSTRSLGNAVKDACVAIADEVARGAELITVADASQ